MQVCNDMEEDDDFPDETTEDTWEMKVRRQTFQWFYYKHLTILDWNSKIPGNKQKQGKMKKKKTEIRSKELGKCKNISESNYLV